MMKQIMIIISPLLLILLVLFYYIGGIKAALGFWGVIVFLPVFIRSFEWWVDFVCNHFN